MKILVVDDEEIVLRFVSTVLRGSGHTVLMAVDGPGGLDALARHRPDLLISDVVMPTMTGPELAAAARRLQPDLSILLMSGSEQPDGYTFLAKPFRARSLLAAVQEAASDRGARVRPPGSDHGASTASVDGAGETAIRRPSNSSELRG